ncbi:MAG: tetratricopeptide repeat protein [Chloroflexota bacterium]
MAGNLELAWLGRPQIVLDNTPITGDLPAKALALLCYLSLTRQPHSRERLASLLWGDMPDEQARNNLRGVLTRLRKQLEPYLIIKWETVAFDLASSYRVDVEAFEAGVQRPLATLQSLQQAVDLYRGEFLEDFHVHEAVEFEDWAFPIRERLHGLALRALYRLANAYTQQRNYRATIACADRILALESWQEEAHRLKMHALARLGQPLEALAQFEACKKALAVEFGVEPGPETAALYQKVASGQIEADQARQPDEDLAPPFQAPPRPPFLIGRERELAWLRGRLQQSGQPHVYAITGMAGVGKTAVATDLAHELSPTFKDGVLWANLATSDPAAVLESWGQVYGLDFSGQPNLARRLASLRETLAEKQALLVLDDVFSVEKARRLLPGGTRCAVLLTTRDVEIASDLNAQTLPLTELSPLAGRQMLVELLGERRVTAEGEAADAICALLGQLPLALELIGQRLKSREQRRLADVAARLRQENDRLAELSASDREVRASFAISWESLDGRWQRLFSLLGLFGGRSFAVEALAHTAGLDEYSTGDGLHVLTKLSLVNVETGDRYRQHSLLALFASEKLGNAPEAAGRLAAYHQSYAEQHRQEYDFLQPEWENLTGGMGLAFRYGLSSIVLAYAATLSEPWFTCARFSDARQGFEWASQTAAALPDTGRQAHYLWQWGRACIEQADYPDASRLLRDCLPIYERGENAAGVAQVQSDLARIALEEGRLDEASALLMESRRIREQLGDQIGVAATDYRQARIAYQRGQYPVAEQLARQALAVQETAGDRIGVLRTLRSLADSAFGQKEYGRASDYGERARQLAEELQDEGELAMVFYILSDVGRKQGDLLLAQEYAEKSLPLFQRMGDRKWQAIALYQMSLIHEDDQNYPEALNTTHQSIGILRPLGERYSLANVLIHLGDLELRESRPEQARAAWQEALSIAIELSNDALQESAGERLEKLDNLGQPPSP